MTGGGYVRLVSICIFSVGFLIDTTVCSANDQHHLSDDIDVDPQKTGVSVNTCTAAALPFDMHVCVTVLPSNALLRVLVVDTR